MIILSACGAQQVQIIVEPQQIFPEESVPDAFSRAYSMTESPDGLIRVFAKERRNETLLYEMRKQKNGTWSEPVELQVPRQFFSSGPSFSPADGFLYFATDETLPARGTGKDLNIWRIEPQAEGWGEPEPLSEAINTGARETTPAMDANGVLYFSTDHPRAGGGGLDIMQAIWDDDLKDWQVMQMPPEINSPRADTHLAVTADGNRLFFYSHREPKFGFVDIWMSQRDAQGVWQAPVNLGAKVNTPGIDFGPGLSGDNKTFFFSRDGLLMEMSLEEALDGTLPRG